jgi:predicted N-acetyltransferase YhbS
VPPRIRKGLGKYPIPVILLARLAVDISEQGQKLGKGLLKDALLRALSVTESIGARAILVHAKDQNSKAFYQKFGFEPSPLDEFHLYLLMKDVQKILNI